MVWIPLAPLETAVDKTNLSTKSNSSCSVAFDRILSRSSRNGMIFQSQYIVALQRPIQPQHLKHSLWSFSLSLVFLYFCNKCAAKTKKQTILTFWELQLNVMLPCCTTRWSMNSMWCILSMVQTSAKVESSEVTTDIKDKMSLAAVLKCLIINCLAVHAHITLSRPIKT